MHKRLSLRVAGVLILLLSACDQHSPMMMDNPQQPLVLAQNKDNGLTKTTPVKQQQGKTFKTVEWTELMPESDLQALLNPPSYLDDIEDGTFEDQISSQIQNSIQTASDDKYQQALISTTVIDEMNGQNIRIPGFIVPLEFNDEQAITQFFLVPFFGACIHLPPPPPNQMIFVTSPTGIFEQNLYDPYLISGTLETAMFESEIGTAAYIMQMQAIAPYTE